MALAPPFADNRPGGTLMILSRLGHTVFLTSIGLCSTPPGCEPCPNNVSRYTNRTGPRQTTTFCDNHGPINSPHRVGNSCHDLGHRVVQGGASRRQKRLNAHCRTLFAAPPAYAEFGGSPMTPPAGASSIGLRHLGSWQRSRLSQVLAGGDDSNSSGSARVSTDTGSLPAGPRT